MGKYRYSANIKLETWLHLPDTVLMKRSSDLLGVSLDTKLNYCASSNNNDDLASKLNVPPLENHSWEIYEVYSELIGVVIINSTISTHPKLQTTTLACKIVKVFRTSIP